MVARPLHPAVEIFRIILTSAPSARERLRIATTVPRPFPVVLCHHLPLSARALHCPLVDDGDQYRTTCPEADSSRCTIERDTTIRDRQPGLLRQEIDEHPSRRGGKGGLIACHLGSCLQSQPPAQTVLKSTCRREAISVDHTVANIPEGAITARDHILPAMLRPIHPFMAHPRPSRLIAAAGAIGVASSSIHRRGRSRALQVSSSNR